MYTYFEDPKSKQPISHVLQIIQTHIMSFLYWADLRRHQYINKYKHLSFFLWRISKNIPTTKDVEPLLEIDGDIRSFEVFLSSRTPVLAAKDVEMFLPCTVNLDPKLREIIAGTYTLSI